MTLAIHWQVPSQISLGKVESLHFSNKKIPNIHIGTWRHILMKALAPFQISTWQALEQYPPTGGLQPGTVLQSNILVP